MHLLYQVSVICHFLINLFSTNHYFFFRSHLLTILTLLQLSEIGYFKVTVPLSTNVHSIILQVSISVNSVADSEDLINCPLSNRIAIYCTRKYRKCCSQDFSRLHSGAAMAQIHFIPLTLQLLYCCTFVLSQRLPQ